MTHNILPGDTVWTKVQFYFLEATHPKSGDTIEVRLPRRHQLTVSSVNDAGDIISVHLPNGYIAKIYAEDLELSEV